MRILEKFIPPKFDWIQLEVSGLCNANCFYCPHTVFKDSWKGRNITLEEFQRIFPYLKRTKLLYLQGWGEPFCNQELFKMMKIAKEIGCTLGTTTNGMLIKDSDLEKIVEYRVDIIAFSLTGINTNDILRKGTKIEKVFYNIEELRKIKNKKKTPYPKISIAYMLLRSNLSELDELIYYLENRGISDVVVSLLDFIPHKNLLNESIVPKNEEEYKKLRGKFIQIAAVGKQRHLNIYFNLPHPTKKAPICTERPKTSLFINSLGFVSPCVYTGIPIEREGNIFFGNINERSLKEIWKSTEYREFRKSFDTGKLSSVCASCNKMRIAD